MDKQNEPNEPNKTNNEYKNNEQQESQPQQNSNPVRNSMSRMKKIPLDGQVLLDILQAFSGDVPPDAQPLCFALDSINPMKAYLFIQSDSFRELSLGERTPEYNIRIDNGIMD